MFNKKPYNEKVDIFAFGTLIWEVMMQVTPYKGMEVLDIKNQVVNGYEIPIKRDRISSKMDLLINNCRSLKSEDRPTFVEIVKKLEGMLS